MSTRQPVKETALRIELISYPDGGEVVNEYHPEARPMYVKKSVSDSTTSTIDTYTYYDGLGRTIQSVSYGVSEGVIKPVVTKTDYDQMGRANFSEGPFFSDNVVPTVNNGISFSYWEMNPISSDYPWTNVSSYDARNRPLEVISPDGSGEDTSNITTTYSYCGLETTITDPDGNLKKEEKDFLGRIIKVYEYLNGSELVTEYNYNAAGDLESVIDAADNTITNTYDTLGRKRSVDDPDMGFWTYTYNDNGNLDIQTDANGDRIKFHYDELDRVEHKEYLDTDDLDVFYEYDNPDVINGVGQLCSVEKSDGEAQFEAEKSYEEFDAMGRAITVTKSITGLSENYTTTYYYDIAGRLEEVVYPDEYSVGYEYHPGTDLLYTVNAQNDAILHASITDYTASGKISDIFDGSNAETIYTYDEKSTRLTGIYTELTDDETVLQNKNYVYSKAGDIRSIIDNLESAVYSYGYDELHRLTSEAPDGPVQTFQQMQALPDYDGIGPVHAVKSIVVPGGNYSYDYDDNGNMIEGWDLTDPSNVVFRSFDYNADNMPTTIVHGTDTTNYIYDGDGIRVKKAVNNTSSTYYINKLFEIENGSDIKYIFAGNLRIAMVDDTGTYYFQKDHLGSTAAITKYNDTPGSISGGVVHDNNLEQYLPFGGQRSSTSVTKTNYTFTDQERDAGSGLYNYGARLYDPVIGQFLTPDSIIQNPYDPQYLNRYSYCRNNPLIYVDPSGHASETNENIPNDDDSWKDRGDPWADIDRAWGMLDSQYNNSYSSANSYFASLHMFDYEIAELHLTLTKRQFQEKYGEILQKGRINIDKNVRDALSMSPMDFYNNVRSGGDWDYKNNKSLRAQFVGREDLLDEFGNVHFGIVSAANGWSLQDTLFGAGTYQVWRQGGGSIIDWTRAFTGYDKIYQEGNNYIRYITSQGFTWGDNPGDSMNIILGWDYYYENY